MVFSPPHFALIIKLQPTRFSECGPLSPTTRKSPKRPVLLSHRSLALPLGEFFLS